MLLFYLAINHQWKPNDKVWYLNRPLGKNEIGKFLKAAFAEAKLNDTNKNVSDHSVRKTSVGRLFEADVQPNFVAQLSGHKNLKSLDSYHSASLKWQQEMSAILNCQPGTFAQPKENQVSTSTTTQQNVFTVQQIQPWAILAGAHIDKFEGCTFNINVFCGDQSKITRLNENWSLSDRGTNRHYLDWHCTFGHFSLIVVSTTSLFIELVWKILSSFIDKVCTKLDFESYFVLFGLETSDIRKPAKCLSLCREANKIICFCSFPLLFGHIINILLTELGRSVWENLDLGHWYRPHCIQSVLATLVKILPYRPPAWLRRAKYSHWIHSSAKAACYCSIGTECLLNKTRCHELADRCGKGSYELIQDVLPIPCICKAHIKDLIRSIHWFIGLVSYIQLNHANEVIVPCTTNPDDIENYFSLQRRIVGGEVTVSDNNFHSIRV